MCFLGYNKRLLTHNYIKNTYKENTKKLSMQQLGENVNFRTELAAASIVENGRVKSSENVPAVICAQRMFRSACAFAQSDQNLHWAHFDRERFKVSSYR